ncbi:hypothetical protein DID99_34810 [Burkholderia sp. Bp8986]|nr:hypothetical protein DIE02_03705 [Burkholderia sp. Bp8991]RQS43906.1 hypothetical protein DID99_34810 [Burkholderia sp. Bp8986]
MLQALSDTEPDLCCMGTASLCLNRTVPDSQAAVCSGEKIGAIVAKIRVAGPKRRTLMMHEN